MANCSTLCSTQRLKTPILRLYIATKGLTMHRILLLVLLCSGIGLAYVLTYVTILSLPVYNGLFALSSVSSDKDFKHKHETSVMLRVRPQIHIDPDVKKEAKAALNVALDLQAQGKKERALKIFQHALALDPMHADTLAAYGEFLELHMNDVMRADHYYKMALEVAPLHPQALTNRQRTMPVVEEIDQLRFNRIDQKRTLFFTVPPNHPALRRAKKEAYFSHIYHSNAIEGNTLSLAQTRVIIETRVAVGGKSLTEQNEVLGLDAALSYVNSTLVGRVGRLTLQDLLDLHLRVLGFVDPPEAGRFRTTQVFVGEFTPPAPKEVPALMDEFVVWLNSEEALNLHPIELAALAHYKLVVIHPFYDGNGRSSRLLMNLILMQAGYPPVSIQVEDRLRYYETLELANNGDIRPFIRFIAEATERTLDEYLTATVENYDNALQDTSPKKNKTRHERIIYIENEEN